MILEAIYLASGFAFLFCCEKPASLRAAQTQQILFQFIRESSEIFFTGLVMILFEGIFQRMIPAAYAKEEMIPLCAAVSYGASRILKKQNCFFLTALAFGFFVFNSVSEAGDSLESVRRLAALVLFFTLSRFVLEGLRFRLLFSSPHKRLAGMPALVFAFSVFLMVLSALKGMGQ